MTIQPDHAPTWLFEKLHPDVELPTRATWESAGYDLRAYLKGQTITIYDIVNRDTQHRTRDVLTLMPGERCIVPCGFKAQLPPGYFAAIVPRSSRVLKVALGVANAPGIIDADYPGEWGVLVRNDSDIPLVIDHNERIAQAVLLRHEVFKQEVVEHIAESTNRTGGFGSTD